MRDGSQVTILAHTLLSIRRISISLCCLLTLSGIAFGQSVVDYNGLLTVNGNKIVNRYNEVVSFTGNSFFGAMITGEEKNITMPQSFHS